MADKNLTAHAAAAALAAADLFYTVQGGNSRKATGTQLRTLVLESGGPKLTLTGGTVVVSTPLISGTQTWNDGGVTFKGVSLDFTLTAAAAASRLLDIQLAGASILSVTTTGKILASIGYSKVATNVAIGDVSGGISFASGASFFQVGGTSIFSVAGAGLTLGSGRSLSWAATDTADAGGSDTFLVRDAANTLALRNAGAAQTSRVYNTWASASEGEWLEQTWDTNIAYLKTTKNGGSTTLRNLVVQAGGDVLVLATGANPAVGFRISSGNFIASLDNTYDIGASGATRPRNVYVAGNVTLGGFVAASDVIQTAATFAIAGASRLGSTTDGLSNFTNNAGTGFTALLLGPSGTTFNRIKHEGTAELSVKLADDSAYSTLTALSLRTPDTTVGALPAAAAGNKGQRRHVTDANAATFGTTVAAGGANIVPVFSTGAAWIIG